MVKSYGIFMVYLWYISYGIFMVESYGIFMVYFLWYILVCRSWAKCPWRASGRTTAPGGPSSWGPSCKCSSNWRESTLSCESTVNFLVISTFLCCEFNSWLPCNHHFSLFIWISTVDFLAIITFFCFEFNSWFPCNHHFFLFWVQQLISL